MKEQFTTTEIMEGLNEEFTAELDSFIDFWTREGHEDLENHPKIKALRELLQ